LDKALVEEYGRSPVQCTTHARLIHAWKFARILANVHARESSMLLQALDAF
jgi:hypothetical protein